MPDITEGLSTGEDVNSQAGFEAALARQAGVDAPEGQEASAEPETDVASGLTFDQPRDQQGRFATEEPEAQAAGEEEGPAEGQPAEGDETDPAIAELLGQHGGDAAAALAALVQERENAQSLIGRQGNEVGELRERLARLEGQLEATTAPEESAYDLSATPVTDETVSQLEGLYERNGAQGLMGWVIENRPDLIDTAVEVWGAEQPVAAARWGARYERFLADEQAGDKQEKADPVLDDIRNERMLVASVDQARSNLEIADQEWPSVRDQVLKVFNDDTVPDFIKRRAVDFSDADQAEAMKSLVQIARSRALSAATAEATQAVNDESAAEAVARKKAATVATGSLRPVQERKPEDGGLTKQEREKRFHDLLMSTETTSVRDGLTFGKS